MAGLTISGHAQLEALCQPAGLTPVPVDPVYDAVLLTGAVVVDDGGLRAPEETLATLTRDHTVVNPTRLITAHLAGDYLDLG